MPTTLVFNDHFEIPFSVNSLDAFRAWMQSDEAPADGRVDYLSGRIEVDMSPEELFTHGKPKVELSAVLSMLLKRIRTGHLFCDSTRVANTAAGLSAEPDLVFVSHAALDAGSVRLVPKASGAAEQFVELEGSPDMVCEIVSDSSVAKDKQRLPICYFAAGVREFWLLDARGESLEFVIHRRGVSDFQPAAIDESGFQHSEVFATSFRLDRQRDERGHWEYDLRIQNETPQSECR